MKKFTMFFVVMISLMLISCANLNDEWIDLGNNYVCQIDADTKSIYNRQLYYKNEIYSKIIDYKYNERYIIAKQNPDYDYYKTFVRSDYSSRFAIYEDYLKNSNSATFKKETTPFIRKSIIADSLLYKLLKSKGVTAENQTQDWEKIDVVLDSIFQYDKFYKKVFSSKENYWIIDKQKNIRSGPFLINEFEKELVKRNIDLRLW